MKRMLLLLCVTLALSARAVEPEDGGLLLHLPLKSDVEDHSGNGHPVKVHNEIQFAEGGAYFAGESNWLGVAGINLSKRPFTVAVWIKTTGNKLMYGLVDQRDANRSHHWLHLMLRGTRQPYLGFYINDAISPHPADVGRWTHLVFAYDGTYQMIWVNGEPVCARKAGAYRGSKGLLVIGKSPRWTNVPSHDFEGYMRDFRLYGRVLKRSELRELAGQPVRRTSSLAEETLPDPADMPVSRGRARDGGVPYLFIDGPKLLISGESAQIYEIEATSSLTQPWESLGHVTNRTGRLEFHDDAAGRGQRFYRIKIVGTQ